MKSMNEPIMLLNYIESKQFMGLTSASLRPLLLSLANENSFRDSKPITANFAWGVRANSLTCEPIALLLARIDSISIENTISLEICSLAVREPWQGSGIARSLLNAAIKWAEKHFIDQIYLVIPDNQSCSAALKRLTCKEAGWNDMPGKVIVTLSDSEKVGGLLLRLEKMAKRQKQRWGWRVEPYKEALTPELQARLTAPENINMARPYDPSIPYLIGSHSSTYSRLLFSGNKLIGWLVAHQISPELLRYDMVWVDPGWEKSGGLLAMVADVMRAAHFQGIEVLTTQNKKTSVSPIPRCSPIPRGCFSFHPHHLTMPRMSERHFRPAASQWVETRVRFFPLT